MPPIIIHQSSHHLKKISLKLNILGEGEIPNKRELPVQEMVKIGRSALKQNQRKHIIPA